MAHTCPKCQATLEALSRLRLHDCPGPITSNATPFILRALGLSRFS